MQFTITHCLRAHLLVIQQIVIGLYKMFECLYNTSNSNQDMYIAYADYPNMTYNMQDAAIQMEMYYTGRRRLLNVTVCGMVHDGNSHVIHGQVKPFLQLISVCASLLFSPIEVNGCNGKTKLLNLRITAVLSMQWTQIPHRIDMGLELLIPKFTHLHISDPHVDMKTTHTIIIQKPKIRVLHCISTDYAWTICIHVQMVE